MYVNNIVLKSKKLEFILQRTRAYDHRVLGGIFNMQNSNLAIATLANLVGT